MLELRRIIDYLKFYLKADTLYGIHSPAVFKLLKPCFEDGKNYYDTSRLIHIRDKYLQDHSILEIQDSGAGSKYSTSQLRSVSSIVKNSSSDLSKCKMLFNLSRFFKAECMLELGTNLGLGAAHIYAGNKNSKFHTVEGDPSLYDLAKKMFDEMNFNAIKCHNESFSSYLDNNHKYIEKVDFAFIDGNHKYQSTLDYCHYILNNPKAIKLIIVDDIYWSKEMTAAWNVIKKRIKSGATIDLFNMGLVFVNPHLVRPLHYKVMRFKYKPWKIGLGGYF